MGKDYAKRSKHPAKNQKSAGWRWRVWLGLIAVILLTLIFYVYRKHQGHLVKPGAPITQAAPAGIVQATAATSVKGGAATKRPVHFVFKPGAPVSDSANYYVLQVASVPDKKQAQQWQKKLEKLGYASKVVKKQAGQRSWYRVQLGPFSSKGKAETTYQALKTKQIPSLVVGLP